MKAVVFSLVLVLSAGLRAEDFYFAPTGTVRAVFYTHENMTEQALIVHPEFRAACARLGIGVLFERKGDQKWGDEAQVKFEEMMKRHGLEGVPFIPFGHSAQATFPWNFAAWNPNRTLCVISFHGDAPRTNLCGYGRENLEWGRTRNIDGIPGLMVEGEYEWWEGRVNPALAFRMFYPKSCISFLCDAGRGHFDLGDDTVRYLIRFVEKSLENRPNLEKIDPKDGYLAARFCPDQKGTTDTNARDDGSQDYWDTLHTARPAPAPYADYRGDRHDAFWYFDQEMADWTERRYAETKGKKMQFLGMRHGGKVVPFNPKRHVKLEVPLELEPDGETFRVEAFFTTEDRATTTDAHAKTTPRVRYVSGPAIEIAPGVFKLDRSRIGTASDGMPRWNGMTVCAEADGNDEYKTAVQEMTLRFRFPTVGAPGMK